jgi:alkylated DNA repair dioxygenase AlkB
LPDLRYLPDAIPDADRCFARLVDEVEWSDRMRARRTASFGRPYNYSGQVYAAAPMPPLIAAIAERAGRAAGHGFDNCLLNFYATGDHTMGFHHDAYDGLVDTSWIAIVSLGAARPIVFRSVDRTALHQLTLAPGSILLMNQATQAAWAHAIPRAAAAGPRISATFRQFAT